MEIVSAMGSGYLGRELELENLVEDLKTQSGAGFSSDFSSRSMVTMRFTEDGPAYTAYTSGSFQVRGTTSNEDLHEAAQRFVQRLRSLGIDIKKYEFEHATLVVRADLEEPLDLDEVLLSLGIEDVEYEPEQFPGLIYRDSDTGATLILFNSGKVMILGTKKMKTAQKSMENVRLAIE